MIQRKGPDGKVYQFPEGTSEKVMSDAFSSIYNSKPNPSNTDKLLSPAYVAQQTPFSQISDELSETTQGALDNASTVMGRNKEEFGSALQDRVNADPSISINKAFFGESGRVQNNRSGMSSPQYGTPQEAVVNQDARPQNMQELGILNLAEGVIPASLEVLGGTVTAAAKVLSNITPDVIENPTVNTVIDIGTAIADSPLMQEGIELVKENYPKYLTWAKENPFYDRALKATFNLTALATKTPVSKIGTVGEALTKSGNKLSYKNKRKRVEQMLEPLHPETSDMTMPMTPTKTEGILGRVVPIYNAKANEIIDVTTIVPNLKASGSFSDSRNVIYSEITNTAEKLKKSITSAGNPKVTVDVVDQLQVAADNLKEKTGYSLAGGTNKFADDLMTTAIRFVQASDGTAAGLLDARKKLDTFITKHQPKSLTQDYVNSKAYAVSEIRTIMNKAVADSVPDVDVSGMLDKQHKLYKAWDVVGDKAVQESRFAIGRVFNDIVRNKVSMPSTPLSLAYTASGTGYWLASGNGLFTLGALGAATTGAVGYKVLTGPKIRQTLGWLLKGIGKTLEKTKVTATIEQLKLDRLLIVGLLNDLEKDAQRPPLLSAANQ
tara:strand:- start:40 stop:1860 length:1821 start_codon:yes stop_codon:yes gene_type:complete